MLDNVEDSVKVIVVGDGNVGKTSMLRRFCKGDFSDQYKKTIGAEFMEKDVYVKSSGDTLRLMLWDTAGQEVFNALTASYYRGAGAAVLAFSTTDRDSFMNVEKWKGKVEAQCDSITMVMCQTKVDLSDKPGAVSQQEAEEMAKKLNMPFYRISTKQDFNVTELFEFVAEKSLLGGASTDGGVQAAAPAAVERPDKKEKKEKKEKKGEDSKSPDNAAKPISMKDAQPKPKEKKKSGGCVML
jgi:small GTP-binding protein